MSVVLSQKPAPVASLTPVARYVAPKSVLTVTQPAPVLFKASVSAPVQGPGGVPLVPVSLPHTVSVQPQIPIQLQPQFQPQPMLAKPSSGPSGAPVATFAPDDQFQVDWGDAPLVPMSSQVAPVAQASSSKLPILIGVAVVAAAAVYLFLSRDKKEATPNVRCRRRS